MQCRNESWGNLGGENLRQKNHERCLGSLAYSKNKEVAESGLDGVRNRLYGLWDYDRRLVPILHEIRASGGF